MYNIAAGDFPGRVPSTRIRPLTESMMGGREGRTRVTRGMGISKQQPKNQNHWHNLLFQGDNLAVLQTLKKDPTINGKIQLIYIDPPFATARDFYAKNGEKSYSDKILADKFIHFLQERLILMRELLSERGVIFVHLDQRMSHRVKLLLDDIFGEENFRNEIIWNYVSGGISNRFFAKKHDSIFFYSKTKHYKFFPQKERIKQYRQSLVHQDEKGEFIWYIRPNTNPNVPLGVKTYLDKYVQDVWNIPIVNPMANERTGYPTQKPEQLLQRIIMSTTTPRDIVADFFAGSGTTGITAEKLNRRWIMSDKGEHALDVIKTRLATIAESKPLLHKATTKRKTKLSGSKAYGHVPRTYEIITL